jgi:hypothetical protein
MATRETAQGLAGLGRNGDSTLVHMQPQEVEGLQALAQANGTSLTINPETGLPEAFSLGGFFRSMLPTIAGFGAAAMSGGTLSPMVAGILAGSATGALTNKDDPLMGAAMGGLGGYGGSNLFAAAQGFAPAMAGNTASAAPTAVEQAVSQAGGVMDPLMNQQISMFTPAGGATQTANLGAMTAPTASSATPSIAPNFKPIAGAVQGTGGYQPTSLLSGDTSNLTQAYQNVAADPMKFIGQNKMAVGMPLAGAALSGLEPSDMGYGTNLAAKDTRGRYDPYASLNLSGDTGLRLYAQGGPVSFADGGAMQGGNRAALTGGGSGALEGSGLLPLDVSDINQRLGYNPEAQQRSGMGMMGMGSMGMRGSSMPTVEVPRLGMFADNDQIETARTAYEQQLAAAMGGRGGMGSTPNAGMLGRNQGYSGMGGQNNTTGRMGMASYMGNNVAPTAKTASTAETALTRLNLNKDYAMGGTIQGGGLQSLYGSMDGVNATPDLSKNGYGMGRMQNMAASAMPAYAKGGPLREGGFVVPADVVSHLGNGSTNAGLKLLAAKFGAKSITGAGDGMSDSIPTTIEGKQKARVADGEAFISPEAVAKHGGTKKFYDMMDRVRKERTGSAKQGKRINAASKLPA